MTTERLKRNDTFTVTDDDLFVVHRLQLHGRVDTKESLQNFASALSSLLTQQIITNGWKAPDCVGGYFASCAAKAKN
ncbi:hypothetical protein [Enterovibrio norvegicus]|uniref:hypothetical protein n=1 Tax=Enterovibrio norvegicus TaxID=188144 RepID=UPI00352CF194